MAWGNRHLAPEGTSVRLVDAATGLPADPVLVDRNTGRPLDGPGFVVAAGPAASERTRERMERVRAALTAKEEAS